MIILEPSPQLPPSTAGLPKGHLGVPLPAVERACGKWPPTFTVPPRSHSRLEAQFHLPPFTPISTRYPRNVPSLTIGAGTDDRVACARRAEVPIGGNAINIAEDLGKYPHQPCRANRSAAKTARQSLPPLSESTGNPQGEPGGESTGHLHGASLLRGFIRQVQQIPRKRRGGLLPRPKSLTTSEFIQTEHSQSGNCN
jgi:hypothetical protein